MSYNPFYGSLIKALTPIYGSGNVIIAGGCLRDFSYGYDPKDIDIFVNLETELDLELSVDEATTALESVEGVGRHTEKYNIFELNTDTEYGKENDERHPEEDKVPSCVGVFELYFESLKTCPIQLIAKPLPEFNGENLVSTFDYNLIQQYIDTEDGLIQGKEEVQKQIAERALYLRKTGDAKTEERVKRFLERTSFEPSNKEKHHFLSLKRPINKVIFDIETMNPSGGFSMSLFRRWEDRIVRILNN